MAQIRGYIPYADRPAGKKQDEWIPVKVELDSSGEFGVLKVDTELSIDALSLNIDNLKVASTDGTVGNAKYIKVAADGTVQIAGTVTPVLGVPEHWNGTVDNTGWGTVTFSSTSKHIQIENTSAAALDLLVSFDNGTKYRTLRPAETLDIDCAIASVDVKGTGVVATGYEMLIIV